MKRALVLLALAVSTTLLPATLAQAGARRFAWNYESTTTPQGLAEYEQWVTWKTDEQNDHTYDRLEFRHEFEYGLTDRLQVGLYLADWRYTRTAAGSDTQLRTTSVEVIYNLAHPATSAVGAALYGEVALGQEKFAVEAKLLLEKPLGRMLLVGNTVFEGEWEDTDWVENVAKFAQTLGLNLELSPRLMLGLEGVYEVEFADMSDAGPSLLHLGPSLAVRAPSVWLVTSPLFQLTDEDSEPDLLWRTLVGFPF